MYSDGLIERRGEVITHGMERLADTATVIAREGWPDHPAVTFASMLSVEERTDDIVVLCINYAGSSNGRISASPVGTSRDGMSTLHLEPVVESTPVARHWVAAHLRDLPAEVSGCAALLTSELVTNAVLHAATPMSITLHTLPDRIRIDVADGNPAFPSVKEYGKDAATGRGLTLFNTLASNWGVQAVDGGKIVWFELPVDFPVATHEHLRRQFPVRPDRRDASRPRQRSTSRRRSPCGSWAYQWRSCRSRARNTRPCSASSG